MADGVKLSVSGRKGKLFSELKKMNSALEQETGEISFEHAQKMAALASRLAPVDDGDLKKSIVATMAGMSTPRHSQPGGSHVVKEGGAVVTAGNSQVRYPHLVEHGTPPHVLGGIFKGGRHPGTSPQPFFWPAYRSTRKGFLNAIRRRLRKLYPTGD